MRSNEIDVKSVTEITLNDLLNEPTSKYSGNSKSYRLLNETYLPYFQGKFQIEFF
jgi:hypothetical protein